MMDTTNMQQFNLPSKLTQPACVFWVFKCNVGNGKIIIYQKIFRWPYCFASQSPACTSLTQMQFLKICPKAKPCLTIKVLDFSGASEIHKLGEDSLDS